MLLDSFYDAVKVHRRDKVIMVTWDSPHQTLSTCPVNGGIRRDLKAVFNHQVCEPRGHHRPELTESIESPVQYLADMSRRYAIPEPCAAMATAVNMNCAAVRAESYRNSVVAAITTAGVESNAARAGDPASYFEENGRFRPIADNAPLRQGTVNSIICTNEMLTPSALVSAVIVAAEAKTAAFQELAIRSRYSDSMATGTGTDQIVVCALMDVGVPLKSADKHSKIGELIGKAVHRSLRSSVALQNGIAATSIRSLTHHLIPYAGDEKALYAGLFEGATCETRSLLTQNINTIDRDPLVVSAVMALLTIRDRILQEVLSPLSIAEVIASFGAQLSAAVSGKFDRVPEYRKQLPVDVDIREKSGFIRFIGASIAIGFSDKWP
jgi:adenosylcobinamide amidohydrolase